METTPKFLALTDDMIPEPNEFRVMSPGEFRRILARLGLSQVDAARLLGVNERTIRRYLQGDHTLTRTQVENPTAVLLRLLDIHPELVPQLKAVALGRNAETKGKKG